MSAGEAAEQILREFDDREASFTELRLRVKDLVDKLLDERGIRVHTVVARVKKRPSLERKLHRHDPPYPSLDAITDLVGARVITYFSDEVDRVRDLLDAEFEVDTVNSRDVRATIDPDRFGYVSLQYVVSVSPARTALPEWRRFAGFRFEIQVRSILQHAWAEIEHDRGYHTESDVPEPIRRRWSRVAALLELADSEFVALRDDASERAGAARSGDSAASTQRVASNEIVATAVASAGAIEPGEVSAVASSVSIRMQQPLRTPQATIRLALETPDVSFEGTPTLSTNRGITASVALSPRDLVATIAGPTQVPPSLVIGGLRLRAASNAIPGVVSATIAVDDSAPIAIASLGTISPTNVVDVRAAASPTVFVGRRAQQVGLVSIIERRAAALNAPGSSARFLRVRLVDMADPSHLIDDALSEPPWIVVTSGDLKLKGPAGSGATVVQGVIPANEATTAEWEIFSASTAPSHLEVHGAVAGGPLASGALNGPAVDVGTTHTVDSLGLLVEMLDADHSTVDVKGLAFVAVRVVPPAAAPQPS